MSLSYLLWNISEDIVNRVVSVHQTVCSPLWNWTLIKYIFATGFSFKILFLTLFSCAL